MARSPAAPSTARPSGRIDLTSCLGVELGPGLAALTGVVAVVHARAVEVRRMSYDAGDERAFLQLVVGMDATRARRLAHQLDRRVDVTAVHVTAHEAACGEPGAGGALARAPRSSRGADR